MQAGPRKTQSRLPTAATLVANSYEPDGRQLTCVYCDRNHAFSSCSTVPDAVERKKSLRKTDRCFVCLKRHRDCCSTFNCNRCRGRYHVSTCPRASTKTTNTPSDCNKSSSDGPGNETSQTTSSLCAGAPTQSRPQD